MAPLGPAPSIGLATFDQFYAMQTWTYSWIKSKKNHN